jgi:hypothetical protein
LDHDFVKKQGFFIFAIPRKKSKPVPMSFIKAARLKKLLILPGIFLITACGGEGKEEKKNDGPGKKDSIKEESSKGTGSKGEKDAPSTSVLPTTLQVASSFKKAGLPYQKGLALDPGMVKDLVDPSRKKLVFGAYSADLAYLVLNEKGERALKTMKALMKLSKSLNLSSVFDTEKLAKRFRSNISQRDSLIQLIIEVQERFDTYVAKNRTQKLRTIAYAGGWTEGVYLAAKVEIDDKKKIHLEVEEQMTILDKLLKALERDAEQDSGPLADLMKQLKKMKRTYEKDAPKPGEELPDELMKSLKEQALKARRIISNEDP